MGDEPNTGEFSILRAMLEEMAAELGGIRIDLKDATKEHRLETAQLEARVRKLERLEAQDAARVMLLISIAGAIGTALGGIITAKLFGGS